MFCVSFDTDNALLCALCYFISYGALPLFVLPRATCSSSGNLAYVATVCLVFKNNSHYYYYIVKQFGTSNYWTFINRNINITAKQKLIIIIEEEESSGKSKLKIIERCRIF